MHHVLPVARLFSRDRTPKPGAFFGREALREDGLCGGTASGCLPRVAAANDMMRPTRPCPGYCLALIMPIPLASPAAPMKDGRTPVALTPSLAP